MQRLIQSVCRSSASSRLFRLASGKVVNHQQRSFTKKNSNASSNHDPMTLLPYKNLPFDSVEIDVENISIDDSAEFGTRLWSTISAVHQTGTQSVFLKVPLLFAHFIPIAGLYDFKFHHAEGDVATMLLWLGQTECKVPPFATHHLGVGGMVVVPSDNGNVGDSKLLVVKEKSKIGGWKLPGGYANLGEDIGTAAAREIIEETGIRSVFQSVLTLRHSHNIQFGRSDMYVICRMSLATNPSAGHENNSSGGKAPVITIDSEIEDAKWISLREFRQGTPHPMLQAATDLLLNNNQQQQGLKETSMPSLVPGRKEFKLYHPSI